MLLGINITCNSNSNISVSSCSGMGGTSCNRKRYLSEKETAVSENNIMNTLMHDHYSMDHFRDSSGFVYLCFSDVREDYTY